MNNKNGFTLIELLAVIVILAVLALIVTPIVTGIISKAKASADLRSAEGYVKSAEDFYASTLLDSNKVSMLGSNVIDKLEVSSKVATGKVVVYPKGSIEMAIVIGNKCYRKSTTGTIRDIEIVDDIAQCSPKKIYDEVIASFPQLEVGSDGCKTPGDNNYTYMGGCYLKGKLTNNYLWYNGFLWRIMGINNDESIRMITEENVTAISYDDNNTNYGASYINDWLNNYFYNYLRTPNIIENSVWCNRSSAEYISDSKTSRTTCSNTIENKIGTISIDEYNLALSSNSYLDNSQYFWTLTPFNSTYDCNVYHDSCVFGHDVTGTDGLRPVINISKDTVVSSGNGLLDVTWNNEHSPYILSEDVSSNANLKDKASSGEYVKLADKTYRVVSKDANGNTKLILDGYYEETAGTKYKMTYGGSNTFSISSGIGKKLNSDVLNYLIPSTDDVNRNKLVTDYTWYQSNYVYGNSYKVSLNETTPTRKVNATVGLIRIGEMLAGQSYSIKSKNWYWTMTPYNIDSNVWSAYDNGSVGNRDVSESYGLRPVIVVKSDIKITSGQGTPSSPYEI